MPDIELLTFPPNAEQTFPNCEHVTVRIIGDTYFRVDIERISHPKKPRVIIRQDGKGDLIIYADGNRVYDERLM